MIRDLLVITLILNAHSAPSPYYTRSFVQTPTSRVEQYLMFPEKNDAYRVPVSDVNQYSNFQFPKQQQVLYYQPDSQNNHYSLRQLTEDTPWWTKMINSRDSSAESGEEKMMNQDMMQGDDFKSEAVEHEMMTKAMLPMMDLTKRVPKQMPDEVLVEAVTDEIFSVTSTEEREETEVRKISLPTEVNVNAEMMQKLMEIMDLIKGEENVSNTEESLVTTEAPIVELTAEITSNITESPRIIEEITEALTAERITEETPAEITTSTITETIKIEPEIMSRLSELIEMMRSGENSSSTTESTSTTTTKEVQTEVTTEIISTSLGPLSVNNEVIMKMNEVLENIASSQAEDNELTLSTEATTVINEVNESTTSPVNATFTQRCNTELLRAMAEVVLSTSNQTDVTPEMVMRIAQLMVAVNPSSSEETSSTFSPEALSEQNLINAEQLSESTTEDINNLSERISATVTSDISLSLVADNNSTEESINAIEMESEMRNNNTRAIEDNEGRDNLPDTGAGAMLMQREQEEIGVRVESENAMTDVERESTTQRVREGRVSDPTLFIHNNRFYVISGAPEFYANFDAYQKPRTPIFSLQELQPIRPIDTNATVQKIEPFRIYVEDEANSDMKELNIAIQNDNERPSDPLNLRQKDIGIQSMQRAEEISSDAVMQRQELLTGEDRDLSDDSSIAQANPSGIAIAGSNGVASSKPVATAITDIKGLSVASPRATAIAGNFNLNTDDIDDNRVKRRIMRKGQRTRRSIIIDNGMERNFYV